MKIKSLIVVMIVALLVGMVACTTEPTTEQGPTSEAVTTEPISVETETDTLMPETNVDTEIETEPVSQPSTGEEDTGRTSRTRKDATTTKKKVSNTTAKTEKPAFSDDAIVDMNGVTFVLGSSWIPARVNKLSDAATVQFFDMLDDLGKQYNCKIKVENISGSMDSLTTKILSGSKACDLLEMTCETWPSAAAAGYIQPMELIDGINADDPRWIAAYTKGATFGGHVWGLSYARPAEVRACMFYNRDLIAKYSTEDPYDHVKQGTWTFDTLRRMARACTKDIDSDGVTDIYGLMANDLVDAAYFLIAANGGALITDNGDGTVTPSYTSKPVLEAIEFYNTLVNTDKSFKVWDYARSVETWNSGVSSKEVQSFFTAGKAAFMIGESWLAPQVMKANSKSLNYGIVPLPKGPSAKEYCSPSMFARVWTITSNNKGESLKRTVKIFNALAKASIESDDPDWWYEDVQDAYFRKDDTTSIEMYKLCLSNMVPDFSCCVPSLRGEFGMGALADCLFFCNNTPAQYIGSIEGMYDSVIQSTFTQRNTY